VLDVRKTHYVQMSCNGAQVTALIRGHKHQDLLHSPTALQISI
jgi:ribosomal protein S12